MERNDIDTPRTTGNPDTSGSQADANEFSGSGTSPTPPTTSAQKEDGSFDFKRGDGGTEQTHKLRDRAKGALDTAGHRLADVGSGVREKAGTARDRLAGALEAGAERLRERSHAGTAQLAGTTSDVSTAIEGDGKVAQVGDRVAGGMQATADWLREADIDGIKTGIEQQVKEHPGRTLLIAAGLGYLLGRAFRNNG